MNFSNTSKIKILIVEDDQFMQAILQKFLSTTYDIIIKHNGMEALAFMQNGDVPDLIISDLNTPKLSGLDLIKQVKLSDFFNSVPIIILSGEESSEKRIACLDSGADDFIVKPFNPGELGSRIKVALRRSGRLISNL
ncbi:response regulator transcription factor [Mucilaginibacter sp. UR6-11]|uniref:response regulator transcription factor n=1 Tax=Mucilaginibacter sp. UR6-11 TaxID=1435644 RepID=UPI001E619A68|nr:response regulator transcription factor [Mucilaginibacter sp. UR6-11]MCC8423756.1 response regulator transcription factor [Mucilaginibacter sp. UR6-11]